jgi:cytoskeletal protein RodZ
VSDTTPQDLMEESLSRPPLRERGWFTWTVRSLVGAVVVGLAALSVYLWMVIGEWSAQNETLRAEALTLGEMLAAERVEAEQQAEELTLVGDQLQNATDRISDLANEEANAVDDRKVIENLASNYRDCAESRQELIDVLTNSNLYFPGKSNSQVEREITEYCEEVEDTHNDYLKDRGN